MHENLKRRVGEHIDEIQGEVIRTCRRIYENPETGFREYRASSILCGVLQEHGFDVELGIGDYETAFRATLPYSGEGPTVALLAEYDALPEIGHGCGHNIIAGATLAAALGLQAVSRDLPGRVTVIGTPGEEGGGGKILLMNNGVFDKVDAALMVHPGDATVLDESTLAVSKIEINFTGRPSHAASAPERGINALDAVIMTFNAVNAMRQQIPSSARIHGIITDGGAQPNIIPSHSAALFYVRSPETQEMSSLIDRLKACAEGAARATGATVKFSEAEPAYEPVLTNRELAMCFGRNLSLLGMRIDGPTGRAVSTDMGNLSRKIPAIHPFVAICPRGTELHSLEFQTAAGSPEAMKVMIRSALALAMTVIDVITDRTLMQKIKSEMDNRK